MKFQYLGKRSNGNKVNAIGVIIIGSAKYDTIYTGKEVTETDKFKKKKIKYKKFGQNLTPYAGEKHVNKFKRFAAENSLPVIFIDGTSRYL